LLQGASNAVLDARIDPLTGKYIVTQSDTQDIFDGLAIETERTIAAGGTTFEHGLLWGDGVAEINDANLYASMPATDQRQVNEMVRSLAAELPAGVDLSKAKAWGYCNSSGTLLTGLNIESVANPGTGDYTITLAVGFRSNLYVPGAVIGGPATGAASNGLVQIDAITAAGVSNQFQILTFNSLGSAASRAFCFWVFGELENE
jgi:hypothetical protein